MPTMHCTVHVQVFQEVTWNSKMYVGTCLPWNRFQRTLFLHNLSLQHLAIVHRYVLMFPNHLTYILESRLTSWASCIIMRVIVVFQLISSFSFSFHNGQYACNVVVILYNQRFSFAVFIAILHFLSVSIIL